MGQSFDRQLFEPVMYAVFLTVVRNTDLQKHSLNSTRLLNWTTEVAEISFACESVCFLVINVSFIDYTGAAHVIEAEIQ